MQSGLSTGYTRWLVAGVILLALLLLGVWHFHVDSNPAQELARKASRIDLVERMQLGLAASSEAEKSAVLAVTDQDSKTFADQARAATGDVERGRLELVAALAAGTPRERELLSQFSRTFEDLRRVDDEVLALAVKNTNVKAYALLYGPAAATLRELDEALSRAEAKHARATDAGKVLPLAFGVQLALFRVQALLSPHIAEESDAKMDALEATMAGEEAQARRDLETLAAAAGFGGDPDLATATSCLARYAALEAQIVALSRENTNVRSLALSLNQKRKALVLSLDALNALQQAILDEPIPGVTYGRPPSPR